ncbi:unnamed protein product [Pleuronectes platessa]|uniref:Uncharacterized protein n=1 Tax=Pleuronectes platessa TaxID=8262 RepID=A0A9N7U450_PLEPL|nr:unnamed protein product [Pleuronectes platessa]
MNSLLRGDSGVQYLAQTHFGMQMGKTGIELLHQPQPPTSREQHTLVSMLPLTPLRALGPCLIRVPSICPCADLGLPGSMSWPLS